MVSKGLPPPPVVYKTESELREATQEEASKALHDFSWIDLTEPDPKYNSAAMHNKRVKTKMRSE